MKKFYALLLAGVMTVACAMPTMAAPSPVAQVVESAATVTVPVSGASVKALDRDLAQEVVKLSDNAQFLSDLNIPTSVKLAAAFDLSYDGTITAGGVQIPLNLSSVADIKVGDYVYVAHRREDTPGKLWEKVGEGYVGNDMTVTATFTSFSPVVVFVGEAPAGVKAPKTGEY